MISAIFTSAFFNICEIVKCHPMVKVADGMSFTVMNVELRFRMPVGCILYMWR